MTAGEWAALHGRKTGAGWVARCPAHDDRCASLSIGTGHDGRVLLKCFAGCEIEAIVAAAGIKELCGDNYERIWYGLSVIAWGTTADRRAFFGERVDVTTRDRLLAIIELRDSGPDAAHPVRSEWNGARSCSFAPAARLRWGRR